MTNHWSDLQHCKTILVEGSNVAENHPMAFKWIRKAQEDGAIIIHVDPRFSRTSAAADIYARIRPGADVVFLNAMINHVLVHALYDEDYVTTHTNALFLGDASFDFKDGLFSGFDAARPFVRHCELGISARRHRPATAREESRRSQVHLRPATEILRPIHVGNGRARLRRPGPPDPADR
jgi:anaerobic selenocysteine-containing dehydrogenase